MFKYEPTFVEINDVLTSERQIGTPYLSPAATIQFKAGLATLLDKITKGGFCLKMCSIAIVALVFPIFW
ncbi:Uncharacterised protein, partial [Mycoplasmopsis edwardii]